MINLGLPSQPMNIRKLYFLLRNADYAVKKKKKISGAY